VGAKKWSTVVNKVNTAETDTDDHLSFGGFSLRHQRHVATDPWGKTRTRTAESADRRYPSGIAL
jgi:hypothetical protein